MSKIIDLLVPLNIQYSNKIQESGKNSGGTSSFICPDNTAMIGRWHQGDENGDTQYRYGPLIKGNNLCYYDSKDIRTSNKIQESGKNSGGTSSFICPDNTVIVGRWHKGDENGETQYKYVNLYFNDSLVRTKNHQWSGWIQESGKSTGGYSQFICPANTVLTGREHKGDENGNTRYRFSEIYSATPEGELPLCTIDPVWTDPINESSGQWSDAPENKVMTGRKHHGDENGNTEYVYSFVYYKPGSAVATRDHKWSDWMQESGKNSGGHSEFICPDNTILTGREHKGDENGNTRYRYSEVYQDKLISETFNGRWSKKVNESSGVWLTASDRKVMNGRWHEGDENGKTMNHYVNVKFLDKDTIKRKNAWKDNGTFDNPDLLWYAKGVQVMQSRQLSDPTSWWFYAAIHGEYINGAGAPPPSGDPNWAALPTPPNVHTTPLPTPALIRQYWDQCQHSCWFFPPWHRGYVYAIENILRGIIKTLGGPGDWALPYWNYFGPGNEYKIPPAFTQENLPDGTPNPLYVTARYGPTGNGDIYVLLSQVSQKCQTTTYYTGSQPDFYGGGISDFAHFGRIAGALENNPHNGVHVMIGGRGPLGETGLMSDPGTAAIDPIFYLHHCNIDRMWAAWNKSGRSNPTDPNWLNGPTATGDRKFYMPKPDKTQWQYTPAMVNDISQLKYTYDDLSLGVAPALVSKNTRRLRNLALLLEDVKNVSDMDSDAYSELVGSNNGPLALNTSGARTTVKLDSSGWNTVANSLMKASVNSLPDEVYLQLEGIKGNADANIYSVTVNQHFVGHIFLFGLRKASMKDNEHGGEGLTIVFNITAVIDQLHLTNAIDSNSLDVLIQPTSRTFESDKVSIERVSIYRKGQIIEG